MDEVDRVLDDTREALAGRDARIADLQRVVAALGGAPGASQEASREPSQEPSAPASAVEDGS